MAGARVALVNALCLYAEFGVASVPNSVILGVQALQAMWSKDSQQKVSMFLFTQDLVHWSGC